jgi:peptidyl-prolyl cis-trans isomerase C
MAVGSRLRLVSALVALAAGTWSCGSDSPAVVNGPLVEIGQWGADTADLISYRGKLPESLLPKGTDEEIVRNLLKSLVDRRIMIVEGEALDYHRDPEFAGRQYRLLSKRLIETVSQRVVSPNVLVSEAEVEEMYRTYHWDREILPAHILSTTQEDALEVIRLLDQGRDFAELARERSVAPDADKGGFLGQYFGPGDAIGELADAAHGLPIGEFTRTPVRTRDGYEVVKVLDASPIPLEDVRQQLTRGIFLGKFVSERRVFITALQQKFSVIFHADGIDSLSQAAARSSEIDGPTASLPVITFGESHVLTIDDVQRFAVENARLRADPTSAQVIEILTTRVLADSLLVLEAQATGLDTAAEFVEYRDNLYRRMIVTFLRKRKVLETIKISEADVREAYEAGKAGFKKPDQINAREILLGTRAEADAVIKRLQQGEDVGALVSSLSLRPGATRSEGHVHVGAKDGDRWGKHFDTVWNAAAGSIVGPLDMPDGFLLLHIDAVEKDQLRSFRDMALGLQHRLRLSGQYQAFEAYIEELRQRYADRVVWHDDRIAALAANLPWSEPEQ